MLPESKEEITGVPGKICAEEVVASLVAAVSTELGVGPGEELIAGVTLALGEAVRLGFAEGAVVGREETAGAGLACVGKPAASTIFCGIFFGVPKN